VIEDLEESAMLEENLREWHQRGLRRSHKKGLLEGAQMVVLHQIERRFGPLPKSIQTRIQAIKTVEELESLAEKVVTAGSLRDMGFV
jgi:flagellar biosynthesis/type III secretory pathway protein FliH